MKRIMYFLLKWYYGTSQFVVLPIIEEQELLFSIVKRKGDILTYRWFTISSELHTEQEIINHFTCKVTQAIKEVNE